MSILSVANVHFEPSGTNRMDYVPATNELRISSTANVGISGVNFNLTSGGHVTGNVISYNGTKWVSAAPTVSVSPGNSGNVLTSNGTAWISQVPTAPGSLTIANETASSSTFYPALTTITTGTTTTANVSSSKLYFVPSTGTLSATVFNSLSDLNYKTNVTTIENALDIVNTLRGVNFYWKETNQPSMGLIAQEVETQLPQIVTENDGIKTLNYDALIGLLVESIKELKAKIEILENNG